jgi:two-component system response regulator YesN
MKTVMIVDDEKPARELLKMLIDWESAGYTITSEARDGKEAIEQYRLHVHDLIITDIQMPQMDGLAFIDAIKKMNKDQNIIVLSCHEDFNYARQVMKLGIMDYLIKDSLTPENLYTVLKNTFYSKSDERSASNSGNAIDEKNFRVLGDIIHDRLGDTTYDEALKFWNIGQSRPYFFIHALIDSEGTNSYVPEITNRVNNLLTPDGGAICNLVDNYYVILAMINFSHSQSEMLNRQSSIAHSIQACMEKTAGCMITAGVSRICADIHLTKEKSLEAKQALGYRVFLGKGKILYFDVIQNIAHSIKIDIIDTRIKNIKLALSQKQTDCLSNELKNLYLMDLQGIMQYNYLQHVNALLLGLITTTCSESNISYNNLFADGTIPLDTIQNFETVEEMLSWFTEKFQALIKAMDSICSNHCSHQIRKIVQYIQRHYAEDIGLESIAKLYNIHKVHLARSFKENTGFCVNGFIRELRIKEAKNLLKNSDLNVSEIVYKVGFQNFQSFYTVFKKQVGVTPMEFRDQ